MIKAGALQMKQLTTKLKIRILSQTSIKCIAILYSIRQASVFLIVGLQLLV